MANGEGFILVLVVSNEAHRFTAIYSVTELHFIQCFKQPVVSCKDVGSNIGLASMDFSILKVYLRIIMVKENS